MVPKPLWYFGAVALLVGVIVFAVSWDTLSPLERGLNYDGVNLNIEKDAVYNEGRYIIGPGHSFITFPKTYQKIEFSRSSDADGAELQTQTTAGDTIHLSVVVLYKLDTTKIIDIYSKYGIGGYRARFANILVDAIKSVTSAGSFTLNSFYKNRRGVQSFMLASAKSALVNEYAHVTHLFLSLRFSNEVDLKIINQMVQTELVNTEKKIQSATIVRKSISVITNKANVDRNIVLSEAHSTSDIMVSQAEADAFEKVVDAQSTVFQLLADELNLNSTTLLPLLYLRTIQSLPKDTQSKLLVGFKSPIISLE